jgi:predicted DNA-binding helix-hairpin-helix protein
VDVNKAEKEMLARIPGLGMKSVYKILGARKYRNLNWEHLKKIGVALNRARYFMVCNSSDYEKRDLSAASIKSLILQNSASKFRNTYSNQLNLFDKADALIR